MLKTPHSFNCSFFCRMLQKSLPLFQSWHILKTARMICSEVKAPFNWVSGLRSHPKDSLGNEEVINPATGQTLAKVPKSGKSEIDHAVEAARMAFPGWSSLSPRDRGRLLTNAATVIRHNLDTIAKLEVQDTGKPIWEARVDIGSCADAFEYFGGVAAAVLGSYVPLANGSFAVVKREPLGVIGGIGAWNFPMQTCTWKVAPALAAGNCFVYKPSEFTPVTAVTLGEVLKEAGVPDGVYNVVQGGAETGKLLCEHPSIDKLSFTGSVATGKRIMAIAANKLIPITLELGGKSPLIIFEDADLTNAVKASLLANFLSQGEVCSNGTRVYVHESIYETFLDQVVSATKALKIGDPMDAATTVGASINAAHAEKVLGYVRRAVSEGAVVKCGGERVILPEPFAGGYFLAPCILTGLGDQAEAVREEIFGAVMCILKFKSEAEVVKRANDSDFGLAGAVFTKDIQRAHRVADSVRAGTFWINNYNVYPPELPFGGYKSSGLGRENGLQVFEHFTQTKSIYVEMGDVDCGPLMS